MVLALGEIRMVGVAVCGGRGGGGFCSTGSSEVCGEVDDK